MSLIKYAERELKMAGLFDKDSDYEGALGESVMELIQVFSQQGHSGFSASRTIQLFSRLAGYKPLLPLTFADNEWVETKDKLYQNKRNSAVFKKGRNGKPYYISAYVMVAVFPDGHTSSWNGSIELTNGKRVVRCYIKNYAEMPTIEIRIPVKYTGDKVSDWEFLPIDKEKLEELERYYDVGIKYEVRDE